MLNVVNQSAVVLKDILLSVIMLNVLAPHSNINETISIMTLTTEGWYAECH
jgi:hypothetical protein